MLKNFLIFTKERFSFAQILPLVFFFTVAIFSLSSNIFENTEIASFFVIFLEFWLFLFFIRLLDDLKDVEYDKKEYPERPVARGVVSERNILLWAAGTFILALAITIFFGKVFSLILFFVSYLVPMLFFFEAKIKNTFRKHFALYIFLHQLNLIPLNLFLLSFFGKLELSSLKLWLSVGLLFFFFSSIEILRKIKTKDKSGPETYSGKYGVKKSLVILNFLYFIALSSFASLLKVEELEFWYFLPLGIFVLLSALLSFLYCKRENTKKNNKTFFFIFSTLIAASLLATIIFITK